MGTREKVRQLREENPYMDAREIADATGVTRQRVYQLLKSLGLRTRTAGYRYRSLGAVKCISRTGGVQTKISSTVAGTIAEVLVAADLLSRGHVPFLPVGRHNGHYDVIAVDRANHRVMTFEVRCGTRSPSGGISYRRKRDSAADYHAVVITGEPIVYDPEIGAT